MILYVIKVAKVVTLSTRINAVNAIWFVRNQNRFNNIKIHWRSSITRIMTYVNLSGNFTNKVSSPSIYDFVILKAFNVNINPPRAPTIIVKVRKTQEGGVELCLLFLLLLLLKSLVKSS